jgi:hypothetical protein
MDDWHGFPNLPPSLTKTNKMEPNSSSSVLGEQLMVSRELNNQLADATKWSRFISIVSIVCLAIFLIAGLTASTVMATYLSSFFPMGGEFLSGIILAVIIIVCVVAGVLLYFLLRFSNLTRKGIQLGNQSVFNDGMAALKTYFIIYGVIALISLFFTALNLFYSF